MKGNLYVIKKLLLTYEIIIYRHTTNEGRHY